MGSVVPRSAAHSPLNRFLATVDGGPGSPATWPHMFRASVIGEGQRQMQGPLESSSPPRSRLRPCKHEALWHVGRATVHETLAPVSVAEAIWQTRSTSASGEPLTVKERQTSNLVQNCRTGESGLAGQPPVDFARGMMAQPH